jgi:hypothetical protein
MKYSRKPLPFLIVGLLLFLTACTPTLARISTQIPTVVPTATTPPVTVVPATPQYPPTPVQDALTRDDDQGSVIVSVTPLNLEQKAETLDFDVALETHSVDLSMDLAVLSTLTTDNGKSVTPLIWDAPMGGHHVSGTLSFPALSEGTSILDGAKTLTLTMKDVAATERIFIWELTGTN